jgi:hypothetical protein
MDATLGTLSITGLSLNIEILRLLFSKEILSREEVEGLLNRAIQNTPETNRAEAAQLMRVIFGAETPAPAPVDSPAPV